jgi:hypothetical protein
MHRGISRIQQLVSHDENDHPACDLECRQGDPEQAENDMPEDAEHGDHDKGGQERFPGDPALGLFIKPLYHSKINREVSYGVEHGEKAHENCGGVEKNIMHRSKVMKFRSKFKIAGGKPPGGIKDNKFLMFGLVFN